MPSPDRADALCLAFASLPVVDRILTAEDLWSDHDEYRYRVAQGESPFSALVGDSWWGGAV
jgi:hypothetical protein